VHSSDRILAFDARDQIIERGFIGYFGDDFKQAGALVGLLGVGRVQQLTDREAGFLRVDDVENCLLRQSRFGQGVQQRGRRIVAARRHGPRDA
jgi:hypothetical protein